MPKKCKLILRIFDQNQWNQEAKIKNSLTTFFQNPPEGVSQMFKAPEIKRGQQFDFSNFLKLETCKNLYKIILVKLNSMIDLVFVLELHNKKVTFEIPYT